MGTTDGCGTMDIVDVPVKEPKPRYGPWIQVAPRKTRRNVLPKEGTRLEDGTVSCAMEENRFDVLHVEEDSAIVQDGGSTKANATPLNPTASRPTTILTGGNGKRNVGVSKRDKIRLGKSVIVANGGEKVDWYMNVLLDMGQNSGTNKDSHKGDQHGEALGTTHRAIKVASDGVVFSVPITLDLTNNTLVRVLSRAEFGEREASLEENMAAYDELALMEQVTERRLTKVKRSARKAPYPPRRTTIVRAENKTPNKVNIGDWIEGMTRDLQESEESSLQKEGSLAYTHGTIDGEVHWRSNLAFTGDGRSK
ncbi:hypothetical protein V6N12_050284 [Hibiscus sabdariffa]|uniref:Uncharacterized protein n=1 Tax=Hibiscus sabdariffa TaxID=183260 RepID=A0ABR2GC93_9ROSI